MEDWNIIKNKLYFLDGSLRDILIYNMSCEDWEKWINYVNASCCLEFKNHSNNISKSIDYTFIKNMWDTKNVDIIDFYATINLGGILVNCWFNGMKELEQDIDPKEFITIQHHNKLMNYLKNRFKII